MKILVIGGTNLDIIAKTKNSFVPEDSNIGHIGLGPGGVAFNIGMHLTALGHKVHLLSAFEESNFGQVLQDEVKSRGIELYHPLLTRTGADSIYLAIEDPQKGLIGAVNQMDPMEQLDVAYISRLADDFSAFDLVVAECNLPQAVLTYLIEKMPITKLRIEGVSAQKVVKLKGVLDQVGLLKMNVLESQVLLGSWQEPNQLVALLQEHRTNQVIITMGEKGVYGYDGQQLYFEPAVKLEAIRTVTGAGDAFFAALIDQEGLSLQEKLQAASTYAANYIKEE